MGGSSSTEPVPGCRPPEWLARISEYRGRVELLGWSAGYRDAWNAELRLLDLGAGAELHQLRSLSLASTARRVQDNSELLAVCALPQLLGWRQAPGFEGVRLRMRPHERPGTKQRPYALGMDGQIDAGKAAYVAGCRSGGRRLARAVHDGKANLVLEFDTGPVGLLWVWALQQLGLRSEGLLRMIVGMAHSGTDPPHRWLYVMLSQGLTQHCRGAVSWGEVALRAL